MGGVLKDLVRETRTRAAVKMKRNHQVGEVIEMRGKRAVVKIGLLPMQVEVNDLVVVKEKLNEG